jgi:hypothetical protein
MDASGPGGVIAKYAVVRPPKDVSPTSFELGFVRRPDASTSFWETLLGSDRDKAPSVQYIKLATEYLDQSSDFRLELGGIDFTDALSRDGDILAGSYRGEGYSDTLGLLRANYANLFSSGESRDRATKFILYLWDFFAASLIAKRNYERCSLLQRVLSVLHAGSYLASLDPKDEPNPLVIDADVLLPTELTGFIEAARRDERDALDADRREKTEVVRARIKRDSNELLLAMASSEFFRAGVAGGNLATQQGPPTEISDPAAAESRSYSGRESGKATLRQRDIEAAHPDLIAYISNAYGVEDLTQIDAVVAAEHLRSLTASLLLQVTS